MFKRFLIFSIVFAVLFFSCNKEEVVSESSYQLDKIEITSFKILDNSSSGVTTETKVLLESSQTVNISDHGVILQKDGTFFDKVALGQLNEKSFQNIVNSGLVKGERYSIYPYIYAKNTFFYGDTLEFESNLEIDFTITGISALQGFINDTISISGKNFCRSSEKIKNILKLGDAEQRSIFESDSLLQFIVLPNISSAEFYPVLTTCGLSESLEQAFSILPPTLDSISPREAYVGQNVVLYGKNFHSNISTLWIGEKEIELEDKYDIDKLTFEIPEGLSGGLLDVKIQVLDKIIEKPAYYQSTSPVIDELDKTATGFLDTLTIRGKYFEQPSQELEILIGNRAQQILSLSDEEIVVAINQYFEVDDPKLVLKTGSFELTEDITMLPPEIISIEEEIYHILDEEIKVKTRYFIPTRENMKVGGGTLGRSWSVPSVDENGVVTVHSTKWLKSSYNWEAQFGFDRTGEIKIDLTTSYGNSHTNYKVYPPRIDQLNKTEFFYGEVITLEGIDFAYNGVSEIYIDDVLQENARSIGNEIASVSIPVSFLTGNHKVKIVTGGQESNEMDFEILDATATSLDKASGTRKDSFTIFGNNLQQAGTYGITANGEGCKVTMRSKNQVEFLLPYNILLEPNVDIEFHYGGQTTKVRTIIGIEPFENYENLQIPNGAFYYLHSGWNTDFEYNGTLYSLNLNGIFAYDVASNSWSSYENVVPEFNNIVLSTYKPSVSGDKVFIPSGNGFQVYDMVAKNWDYIELILDANEYLRNGVVLGENAYIVTRGNTNADPFEFHIYDLNNHTRTQGSLPAPINSYKSKIYQLNGRIIYDIFNENIFMYDIQSASWEDLGHPMGSYKYNYDVGLCEYNDVLYYSGGQGNNLIRHQLYAYDFQNRNWSEKTPMPVKLLHHVMVGQGDYLYFGLGESDYYLQHPYMYRYKISEDSY